MIFNKTSNCVFRLNSGQLQKQVEKILKLFQYISKYETGGTLVYFNKKYINNMFSERICVISWVTYRSFSHYFGAAMWRHCTKHCGDCGEFVKQGPYPQGVYILLAGDWHYRKKLHNATRVTVTVNLKCQRIKEIFLDEAIFKQKLKRWSLN